MLFGFIYVSLGGLLTTKKISNRPVLWVIFTFVFFGLMAGETLVQSHFGWSKGGVDTKLMLVPLTIALFLFVMSLNIKSGPMFIWMRKLSLLMFLSQRIFITIFEWFLLDTVLVKNSMLYFGSILMLTLAFSVAFILLSEKIKFLKKLY